MRDLDELISKSIFTREGEGKNTYQLFGKHIHIVANLAVNNFGVNLRGLDARVSEHFRHSFDSERRRNISERRRNISERQRNVSVQRRDVSM